MSRRDRLHGITRPLRALAGAFRVGPIALVLFVGDMAAGREVPSQETNRTQFRIGVSSATFTEVNENDAKAGMKVWAQTLLRERGLPVEPEQN